MPSTPSFWEMVANGSSSSNDMSNARWPQQPRRPLYVELEAEEVQRQVEIASLRQAQGQPRHRESTRPVDLLQEPQFFDANRYSSESAYRRAVEAANSDVMQHYTQARRHESLENSEGNRRRSSRVPGQHRVYLINCKHCDHFITDRGMKAVLLLRPHITLYSTDAIPNCGPLYPESSFGGGDPSNCQDPTVERTCNCLTQTLGCYGCGVAVGYHIVSPCSRCTSSVAKHQRSSNGHRTVLHCTEITVRERRYVPGERGVLTAKINYPTPRSNITTPPRVDLYSQLFSMQDRRRRHSVSEETFQDEEAKEQTFLPYADILEEEHRQVIARSAASEATAFAAANRGAADSKKPRVMKAGDTVYWSDLVTGGERHEPIDCDELLAMPTCSR